MSKVENFPRGTKLKIGDKFGYLTIIDIDGQDISLECDCKDKNRNQIEITKGSLKTRIRLYCDLEYCKYSLANWITINDQEYSLLPGSIIGWLEIGERVYTDKISGSYNLLACCTGSCNSPWFEINKWTLSNRVYYDCNDPNCSSQNNRLENTSLYSKWTHTKSRLFNPNDSAFKFYDRLIIGLKMELEWIDDFLAYEAYVNTLSPTKKEMQLANPGKRISVDRKDNNYGYIKGNLRWETELIQSQNRRNTINSIIVINIRIDYEINNLTSRRLEAKYNKPQPTISNITNYKTWKNISIQKYIDEYNSSKNICGLTLAEINTKGGLTEEDINK